MSSTATVGVGSDMLPDITFVFVVVVVARQAEAVASLSRL